MGVLAGQRPKNLGVSEGRLRALKPQTRNSVSSFETDGYGQIEPLAAGNQPRERFKALRAAVAADSTATIVREEENYLYAEFKSKLLGFVDDVEFLLDPSAKLIHVRSASRLGREDFGVNRKRIEALRARLNR